MTSYDIIVIGTGAGGSTLAWRLAPTGKRILVLERGDYIPREPENWSPRAVVTEGRYLARERWHDGSGGSFAPFVHYCVGGNTKMYGAALLRLRRSDFDEVRHHGGISPAWPIGYDELEPYYTAAERLYSVHGQRGVDPLDPPSSAAYPFPALAHEPRIAELYDDLEQLGYRPYPLPLALREPEVAAAATMVPALFDGYPDPTETKADAHVVALRQALAHPNVELWTHTRALRLVTDGPGRVVTAVEVDRGGEPVRVSADVIVVACGAINSAALLLRSACDAHPHGLANGSDLVGRNYMTHHNGMLLAYGEARNDARLQKTFGVGDFYRASKASDLPLGSIQLMGRTDRDSLAAMAAGELPGVSPDDLVAHTIDMFLTAEDLPSPDNRVRVRPDGGIEIHYRPNNLGAYEGLHAHACRMLVEADARHGRRAPAFLHSRLGISGVSHQCGTLRFGRDPRTSVLDVDCRAHQLDNLYVADASVFPASGAVNPSLTIMANAMRVADRIAAR